MTKEKQNGFQLIEMLIVQLIGLILIMMLYQHYVKSRLATRVTQQQLQAIFAAETALTILENAIAYSGYIGCAKLTEDFPIHSDNAEKINPANQFYATENHELYLKYAHPKSATLLSFSINTHASSSGVFNVSYPFRVGDSVVLSDCRHAEIKTIQAIHTHKLHQTITFTKPFFYPYGKEAELFYLEQIHFWIGNTAHHYPNGQMIKALMRENHNRNRLSLIEGIKSFELKFIISNGEEVKSNQIKHWAEVVGISIAMQTDFIPKIGYRYVPINR